ncbi:MAG: META domain-containing protein [Natronospirillum sp.]|uniref:META domain-containing protein n=1 Tax=Natronospirillum sp. TaxID=2812955 RepID=UPI0025DD702F|nr:META domain-containing protein [Natronospirillum sp.]MCH8552339.1 META domain-containing protein [Natronospirillum sp.]
MTGRHLARARPMVALTGRLVLTLLLLTACGSVASRDDRQHGLAGNWTLQSVQQGSMRFELGEGRPVFSLRLHSDGRADGRVACNRWQGQARVSQSLLRLERARADRARCTIEDPRISALERRYLAVLQANSYYQLDGDTLRLQTTQAEQWVFQRD